MAFSSVEGVTLRLRKLGFATMTIRKLRRLLSKYLSTAGWIKSRRARARPAGFSPLRPCREESEAAPPVHLRAAARRFFAAVGLRLRRPVRPESSRLSSGARL